MDTSKIESICCLNVTADQRETLKAELGHFTSMWPDPKDTDYKSTEDLIDAIDMFPHFFFQEGKINCFPHFITFEPTVVTYGITDNPLPFDEFLSAIQVYIIDNKIYPYEPVI